MGDLLWPTYDGPGDLAAIEAVPLADRGLPGTTYELLVRAASLWPERVALSVMPDGERWEQPSERTFAQLLADVHRYANLFHALGVRRTDGVALLAPNCDELITATLAAQLAGIAAPINSGLSGEHIAELMRRSGARVLVAAGPELAPEVWDHARACAREAGIGTLLALRPTGVGASEEKPFPIRGLQVAYLSARAAEQPYDRFVGEPPSGNDLAALFHTGGTTGAPKLAAHTHANEVSDAWMIAAIGVLDTESVAFAALPLFHVNALVVTLLAPLFKGHRAVWAGPLGYRDTKLFANFWKVVERYRISFMSGVPTIYAALTDRSVDADISSLRFALVGASPLPTAVRERFESATGVPLMEGYGLTEATCASARSFVDCPVPGSVGQRLPYQQVKTIALNADGEWVDLPTGEAGVLAIGGPTVFPGYVVDRGPGGPVLDGLGKLRDGWLDTGDLARVDAEGFVHLVGRAKDLIIRGGHNIDPAVIETVLLEHPAVTAAQAVGRPDMHAGEVPVAFVTLAPDSSTTTEELCAWATANVFEQAAAPKTVTVLDALPLTHVGKPFKPALRAEATRVAVTEALRDLPTVTGVRGVVEEGTVVAVVGLARGADETTATDVLNRFAITWRLELS
ncbi:acyl-CoA synthetase [Nocardioides guangzhouensis]|uniref:Acyl-CoA synthetase n=1 Tax=Nocardioides guangzhouensis TaxID=2497878 RepID=A0A4Q4ZCP7_9ACTN|nr:acyl-CoA synthetase [Nocardioides guangzhouensis]RYP85086.1 acyl-CoA synthetase [Nocardioides guangzhouensis]